MNNKITKVILMMMLLAACVSRNPEWTTHSTGNDLDNKTVYAIASDIEGGLWVGTQGGISYFDGRTWTFYAIAPQTMVAGIAIGPKEDIWLEIGGSQVANFNKETLEIKNYYKLNNTYDQPTNGIISSIAIDHSETVWIGTSHYEVVGDSGHEYLGGGIFRLDAGQFSYITDLPPHADINSISIASDGAVWVSTNDGVYKYDEKKWSLITTTDIGGLSVISPNGTLWLGTWDAGVYHYDGKTWTSYTANGDLAVNHITCMTVAPNGDLWVGTKENGISRFNGRKWRAYTIPHGSTNNEVTAIHAAPDGAIWIGTSNGVSRYKP
jgi:ligand-binding sensor domain-containing protein